VTTREALRPVLLAQGAYYTATGVAPFVSRRAFEAVTGRKREWWLVQSVGGLVTVIGAACIAGSLRTPPAPMGELYGIAAGSAATLAAIDIVHVARGRIAPTYLLDATAQLGLLGAAAVRVLR
jgi:hypothetical protein